MTQRMLPWFLLLCQRLESPGYQQIKARVREYMNDERSSRKYYFDTGMILLVITSISCFVYEVHHSPSAWSYWFERFAMSVFLLEYLLRLWVHDDSHRIILQAYQEDLSENQRFQTLRALGLALRGKWEYIVSPMALVDLLAILPSYRPLRMLRIFLLFRVIKLFRYTPSLKQLTQVLSEKRFEIYTLGVFVSFMVFASATGIYLAEAADPRSEINTFFDAVYWAVITLSTVGYGDITPQTIEGRFITLILIVSGLAVLSFSTSIIVSAFSERLLLMRERRIHLEVEKLRGMVLICGYGRVGEAVAERLRHDHQALVVLDHRESRANLAERRGFLALCADASSNQVLEEVGIHQRAHTVVCITDSDVTNVFITLTVRQLNPNVRIIARASYTDSIDKLYRAGADVVVTANEMVGLLAAELVNHPQVGMLLLRVLSQRHLNIEALRIEANSPLSGQTVADLRQWNPALILFGVVVNDPQRAERGTCFATRQAWFCFNPVASFQLQAGDGLLLIGNSLDLPGSNRQQRFSRAHP